MGNSKSSALSKELLEELKSNTKYSEAELCTWYQSFLKECPGGKISKQQFEGIYASFFPNADPTEYARHVFRSFDTNADGTLDFKEYIVALHLTSGGKTLQKLEWAFALYDVDGNGTISKNEILEIVRVLLTSSVVTTGQKNRTDRTQRSFIGAAIDNFRTKVTTLTWSHKKTKQTLLDN